MKELVLLFLIFGIFGAGNIKAEEIKDPLLHYFWQIQSYAKPDNKVYSFDADLSGDGNQSVFITDDQGRLGHHGDYGWVVYVPLSSGGYRVIDSGIDASLSGPVFGFIDEDKRYGAITMGYKHTVIGQYLENGEIKSETIDDKPGSADDPKYNKYFAGTPTNKITTYTIAQLKQKYINPDTNNVVQTAPASVTQPATPPAAATPVAQPPPDVLSATSPPVAPAVPTPLALTTANQSFSWLTLLVIIFVIALSGVGLWKLKRK